MPTISPFLNRWLSRAGAAAALEAVADLVECGAMAILDDDGKVLLWSRGAERLLGFTSVEALGAPCHSVLRCDDSSSLCEIVRQGAIASKSLTLQRADATPVRVRRFARAFFDSAGEFVGSMELFWPEDAAVTAPAAPRDAPDDTVEFHGLLTRDPNMKDALRIVHNAAETDATILIRGESGTGKELIARAVHAESPRRDGPFLAVNCAALSPALLESELFGHVRGAFTGAIKDHAGVFQRADRGTLFLDEIAELPLELQAKLLRVIQERDFVPVGGDRPIRVDVRIVAATHRSLRQEVKDGRFREDLMYRLRVVPIFLPTLRERRLDIPLLLWHRIQKHNAYGHRQIARIEPDAMRRLLDYHWPGNVRELQNVVEYAFAVGRGETLMIDDLPPEFRESGPIPVTTAVTAGRAVVADEAALVRDALEAAAGHIDEAARIAGMSRATFWRKRKRYGL